MRLSHSRLGTLVANPKKYKIIYKLGFFLKEKSPALQIGSAVHWGIEHETVDLQEYFQEFGTFAQRQGYSYEQLLSESMVFGYLKHKDDIISNILSDMETAEQLEIIDEYKEIRLTADLPSTFEGVENHSFLGIIDLLYLTDKGFVLIDYKTSRFKPNFDDYLEQIYRYMFLLNTAFPDVPIYKVAIINLRKASIRQKKTETEYSFLQRLKLEYELNEDNYINYHIYTPDTVDKDLLDLYVKNLSMMADFAEHVDTHQLYWWGYSDSWGKDYKGLSHGVKDSWVLYDITDTVYDVESKSFKDSRPATETDMLAINQSNVLHKYDQFEMQAVAYFAIAQDVTKDKFFKHIQQNFVTDIDLLEQHWLTLNARIAQDKVGEETETKEVEVEEEE